ncbi:hypothetical protein [uncultured Cohaesibacter sp.]|uniref:hypothetical protein n=1 Tax=uncultured Cohaesibacter sp. TaxID=1002546 RepID=UPI002AAA9C49|nr:hypothetical protein [uncultured Cohaesibacter sp.]
MKKNIIVLTSLFSVIIVAICFLALFEGKSFAKIKPLFSKREVARMESTIQKALSETSNVAYGSDLVVKDCEIVNRVETARNCADPYSLRLQEFRLDIRETASVTQSSLVSSKPGRQSLLKFHFTPEIEQKVQSAKQQIWEYVSDKHGLRGAVWGEFAESAEQRLVKQYGFDKLGSYDVTQTCGSSKKMRHLPEKLGTYILSGDSRELGRVIKSYHQYCVSSDS